MQTQTSNTLHNAIMKAGSKDHPPMLAPGIDNDIYSIVDACPNACEMWKAIERMVNHWNRITQVSEDDETSKDNEIDKLMALISLSFKKIYKPTNNNLRTSSNTSRANQDNSPRSNRSAGYENQRIGNVAGARETVGSSVVQKTGIQCYNCKEFGHEEAGIQLNAKQPDWRDDTDDDELEDQELEAHYMYMAQLQEVSPDVADSGPIFDDEPLQKILPANKKSILKNTNVLAPGMYKLHTDHTQTRTSQLPQDFRKTNKRVSFSTGVIPTTSVSRPSLKSNPQGDRVMHNNSQGKKQEVEDYRRRVKLSKNKTSVTACNDSLNAKTLNVKSVFAMCDKCVLIDKHAMCVLKSIAKPLKETVASESNKKPRNFTRKLYEHVSKTCGWWYPKFTPSGYKWKPKSSKENVNPNLVDIVLFIIDSGCSKHMTGNLKLLINFIEKFLGTAKFGNEQITPILGYGDLVQGAVTIKRVYYVEGLNHNLFSVGQFCDADLEVAFRKSTCFIRDLKGNDILTGSRGTDLFSITLQDTNCPNLICLMAKATSSQAWLWHHRLSHLNFDTINLLSKNDIVVGLPKLKFVKDHLCSSCELRK
nr:integrase, catalytic region, zinc finger, CCHC-type, peptidase aspartic, catalytic [Tanacetum cinerariifolium]